MTDDGVVVSLFEIKSFGEMARTPNERSLGRALDNVRNTATGDLLEVIDALDSLSDSETRAALNQIVPEEMGAVATLSFNSTVSHTDNLSKRLSQMRMGFTGSSARQVRYASLGNDPERDLMLAALAQQDESPYGWGSGDDTAGYDTGSGWSSDGSRPGRRQGDGLSIFAAGAGTFGEVDGNTGRSGYDFTSGQFTIGMDQVLARGIVGGAMLGYDHASVDIDDDGGEVDVNSLRFGMYGSLYGQVLGQMAFLNGFVGGGYHLYDSERTMRVGGLTRTADASPDGLQLDISFGAGINVPIEDTPWSVYPTISLYYSRLEIESYTESGAGSLSLDIGKQKAHSLRTQIGARLAGMYQVGDMTLIPEFRAMYQNEAEDQSRGVSAQIASGGAGAFRFNTTPIGRDSFILGAGMTVVNQDDIQWYVDYSTELGRTDYVVHNLRVGVSVEF